MNPVLKKLWRYSGLLAALITLTLLAGCGFDEQRLVWSPNGQRAFVFGAQKVFLADANGRLSPALSLGKVNRVAWFDDSQRLALVTEQALPDWTAIARELGTDKAREVEAAAETAWKSIQGGMTWETASEGFEYRIADVLLIYLREHHADDFKLVLRDAAWRDLQAQEKKDDAKTWAKFAAEVGPEKAQSVAAAIESVWKLYKPGMTWEALDKAAKSSRDADPRAMPEEPVFSNYLREHHPEELKQLLGEEMWKDALQKTVPHYQLLVARIEADTVTVGARLHHGFGSYRDVRVAPGGRMVAFVVEPGIEPEKAPNRLIAVTVDGAQALEVATVVSSFPDWAADGRSLAYVQAAGGGGDVPRLGTLLVRGVESPEGKPLLEAEPKSLAGVLLSGDVRVRCLRDGRILFNTAEITLPIAKADGASTQEQLFAIDPARQATLVRLIPRLAEGRTPRGLIYFEVSPDDRRVVFGTDHGEVSVLTLATGEVDQVQNAGDEISGTPQWRTAEEFSYVRFNHEKDGVKPARPCELVLHQCGGKKEDTVLSAAWPVEMVGFK